MKRSKDKCKVLITGRKKPQQHQSGHLLAGEQLYGKGPGNHGIEQGVHYDREG